MNKAANRHEVFCREYLKDLNATRAAIAAGYKSKAARQQGYRLLTKGHIEKRLAELQTERLRGLDITAERVLGEIARLAFSNMQDYLKIDKDGIPVGDYSNLNHEQWAAVQEVVTDHTGGTGDGWKRLVLRTRFKLANKTQNLELLARHLGLLNDKLKITGFEGLAEKLANLRKAKHGNTGA